MKKGGVLLLLLDLLASCRTLDSSKKDGIEYREVPIYVQSEHDEKYSDVRFISYEQMERDLDTVVYLLETAYAGYEIAAANGLDLQVVSDTIKKRFKGKERIDIDAFALAVHSALSPYIEDHHMSISSDSEYYSFGVHNDLIFSGVYVEQKENRYVVVKSMDENVKVDDAIECNEEIAGRSFLTERGEECL